METRPRPRAADGVGDTAAAQAQARAHRLVIDGSGQCGPVRMTSALDAHSEAAGRSREQMRFADLSPVEPVRAPFVPFWTDHADV